MTVRAITGEHGRLKVLATDGRTGRSLRERACASRGFFEGIPIEVIVFTVEGVDQRETVLGGHVGRRYAALSLEVGTISVAAEIRDEHPATSVSEAQCWSAFGPECPGRGDAVQENQWPCPAPGCG